MYRIKKLKEKLMYSDLLRHNTVFFFGTLTISLFNYLYYPVVGRLVNISDFGEIQAVISLFMQLGILLTSFGYVTIHTVGNAKNNNKQMLIYLERIVLMLSILVFGLLCAASYMFKDDFKMNSVLPIILVGLLIVVNVPSTSRAYILQGMKRLKEVSIAGVIFSLGKLLLSVGFIYLLTNDVIASMCGYIVAQTLMLWYVKYKTIYDYKSVTESKKPVLFWKIDKSQRKLIKSELIYGLVILIILSGLTLMYSSDTILARLFFEPHELGLYSAASSVARIEFFVTASVAGVLIATVKLNAKINENFKILIRSIYLVCIIGGIGVIVFSVAPQFFIKLLVGGGYIEGAKLLPMLSVVTFFCSLNNLLAVYHIALRHYVTMVPVLIGVVSLSLGLLIFHSSFNEFITVLLIANGLVFVLLLLQSIVEKKRGYIYGKRSIVSSSAKL